MEVTIVKSKKVNTYLSDRYFIPITQAFKTLHALGRAKIQFKDIYPLVCKNLGATDGQANLGQAPCPYKGIVRDIKGLIRSWVEERSPCSRQYYWRNGKRVHWSFDQRPLLFVNEGLGQKNNEKNWMPYSHVRGNGWIFDPEAAEAWHQPSELVLYAATQAIQKQGCRGAGNQTVHTRNIVFVKRVTTQILRAL